MGTPLVSTVRSRPAEGAIRKIMRIKEEKCRSRPKSIIIPPL
jgi:hypothetical protein